MNQFQYIANIDNDEMIIPEASGGWNEMLEGLGNDTADIEVNFQIPNGIQIIIIFDFFKVSWGILFLQFLLFG